MKRHEACTRSAPILSWFTLPVISVAAEAFAELVMFMSFEREFLNLFFQASHDRTMFSHNLCVFRTSIVSASAYFDASMLMRSDSRCSIQRLLEGLGGMSVGSSVSPPG